MLIDQAWASAAEAAWTTEQWEALKELLHHSPNRIHGDFNIGIGLALLDLEVKDQASLPDTISVIRGNIAHSFSAANTASLNTCHDQMLRLHTLYDLETIAASVGLDESQKEKIVDILDGRLGILGAFTAEKQYLLAIRRAAMTMLK